MAERRLGALARHVCRAPTPPLPFLLPQPEAAGAAAAADSDVEARLRRQGGTVGLPLARQDRHGQLTPESVAEITAQMEAAAARRDFREAAHLQTTLDVLGPKPRPLTLEDLTAADPDTAADLLLEHGFVVLRDCVAEPDLARMRVAYEHVAAFSRAAFERQWAADPADGGLSKSGAVYGKFWRFPMLDDEHDPVAFYPLVDPPLLMETVHRVLGRPTFASAPGGRVCPVADTANAPHEGQGYISWHR